MYDDIDCCLHAKLLANIIRKGQGKRQTCFLFLDTYTSTPTESFFSAWHIPDLSMELETESGPKILR